MRKDLVRMLFVVLAAFALFSFVYPVDLSENDSASSQTEMLQESPARIPTHRDRQSNNSALLTVGLQSTSSSISQVRATSPTLISLSTCILRC
jgi:hypothetical protein